MATAAAIAFVFTSKAVRFGFANLYHWLDGVVDIRRDLPALAPGHRRLLRLDLLGASESAASRDAVADEGLIVRLPIESRGGRVESVIRKPGFEEVLDFRGAAAAIVDCVNVIERGYHVGIEVGVDVGERSLVESDST